jgi:hypothetical protein
VSALLEPDWPAFLHGILDALAETLRAPRVLGAVLRALAPLESAMRAPMNSLQHRT